MSEAKALEYFQGAGESFLLPATEVTETVTLVFTMELLPMSEVGSEHKVWFKASLRLKKGLGAMKKSP